MINYRAAKPEEVDQVVRMADLVFREANNVSPSMGRQFPTLLSEENASSLYIAEDDGKVVSHIGIKENEVMVYGYKLSMASMGAVWTDPEYRGKGIATELLHATFDALNRRKVSLVTISGGRGLYRRNGAMGPMRFLNFDLTGELKLFDCESIKYRVMDDTEDISPLAQIYYREPIRYRRKVEEFDILFKAKPMVLEPDKTPFFAVVAYDNRSSMSEGIAYLLGYENGEGVFNIIEYAGERVALLGAIDHLLKEMNLNSIKIAVPCQDQILIDLLKSLNIEGDLPESSPITVRIINKESLWEDIYPIISERWVGGGMPQSLADLPNDVADDIGLLTSFIFSDQDRPQYGGQWDAIFPLPLPNHRGLNYI